MWADYLRRPEWLAAPSSAQGIYLVLLEILGPKGAQRSARELAEACGVGATCVRDAIRYWRGVGWLEAEERRRADGGRAPNWLRPRPPWEIEELEAGQVTPEELKGRRRQAHVTRYAGLLVAKLDSERVDGSPALFDRLAIGLERGDVDEVLGELLGELVGLREAGLYAGSCKRRHVRRSLEDLVDRRPAFEAEIAELRASGEIGRLFGAQPEGEAQAHGAEDVEGTFRLAELEERVGAQDWEIWIRPLRVFRGPHGLVRLVAPNRYYVDWVADHYAEALDELFAPPELAQELARARAAHADQVAGAARELEALEARLRTLQPGGERAEVRRLAQVARWKLEEVREARPMPPDGARAWELVSDEGG